MATTILKLKKPNGAVPPPPPPQRPRDLTRGDRQRITRFCNDVISLSYLSESMSAKDIPAMKVELQLLRKRAKKLARLAQRTL